MYSSNQNFNVTSAANATTNLLGMRSTQGAFELPSHHQHHSNNRNIPQPLPSSQMKSRNIGLPSHLQFKTGNPAPIGLKSKSPEFELQHLSQSKQGQKTIYVIPKKVVSKRDNKQRIEEEWK